MKKSAYNGYCADLLFYLIITGCPHLSRVPTMPAKVNAEVLPFPARMDRETSAPITCERRSVIMCKLSQNKILTFLSGRSTQWKEKEHFHSERYYNTP